MTKRPETPEQKQERVARVDRQVDEHLAAQIEEAEKRPKQKLPQSP